MGSDHVTISKTFDTHSSVTSPTRRDMNSWKQNTTQVFGGSSRSCSSNSIHVEAPFAQTSVEEGWGYGVDTTTSPEDVEIEMSTHKNILTRQKTERYTKIRQDISSSHKDDGIEFDQIAIVRIGKKGTGCSSHTPETSLWAAAEQEKEGEGKGEPGNFPVFSLQLSVQGPYMGEYSRLQNCLEQGERAPPIIIACTGAGAGLALDAFSFLKGNNVNLQHHVDIIFSTWSLPLLQYVTNTITAQPIKNLFLTVALTRQDDVELDSTADDGMITCSRINLLRTIDGVNDERTCVFFCGAGAIAKILKQKCREKNLAFVGSAVE